MTAGMAHIKSSGSETSNSGVAGAFDNIRDVIGPLNTELRSLVNDSLVDIRANGFVSADTLIGELDTLVVSGRTLVGSISTILTTTDTSFDQLASIFAQLGEIGAEYNLNVSVPTAADLPSVSADTAPLLNNANASLTDFQYQIGNLSADIENVKAQINDSSPTVQDIYTKIDDTVGKVMANVDTYESDYNNYEVPEKIDDYYAWVILSNKIRLPVMIVLLVIPIILTGLWFIGSCTHAYKLMLVGFWWAAAICWLMMILAAVHVALFIPLNEMCNNKEDVVARGLREFVFTNGTNYASSLGIHDPQSAVDALNSAIALALENPNLLLDCSGNDSVVTVLGIDVAAIIDIDGQFDSAKQDIIDKADSIDINQTISDSQPVFRTIDSGIASIQSNVSIYSEELDNATQTFDNFTANYDVSTLWNATAEANSAEQLQAINNYTRDNSPPYNREVYTYDNVSDFNPQTALTPQAQNVLTIRRRALLELIKANKTAQNVTQLLSDWSSVMGTLNTQLASLNTLVNYGRSVITNGWTLVNNSAGVPDEVVNACIEVLDNAVDRANDLASVPDLGKCEFLGNFVRRGVSQGACRETRSSAGGVALCILFLALIWLISWPIILSSKTHYAAESGGGGAAGNDDKFFEQEMKNSRY